MAYSVIVPKSIMADDVSSLNRSVVCGSAIENGNVFYVEVVSASSGYNEVYQAQQPDSGSLKGLWMANTPEIVNVTAADGTVYRGINQDPRNFINASGSIIDAFKPMVGDIILASADCFSAAYAAGSYFAVAQPHFFDLMWAAIPAGDDVTYFKYVSTDYISIGSGSQIGGDQRAVAYRIMCLNN